MPAKRRFRLTDRDIEILTHVYNCRLVTIDHLVALTGRERRRVNNRLVRLTEHKYLYRVRQPLQKYIYTINHAAVPVLVEQGLAPKELLDLRVRLREMSELFLKHSLMVVDIHVTLALASETSHIKLIEWTQGHELYDSVVVRDRGKQGKLSVRPDAYFVLEDTRRPQGSNRAYFFLEADRSTSTHQRFQRKVIGYWHYHQQGLCTQHYGMKNFRVIILTITQARAENLCLAAGEVLPPGIGGSYYFASRNHFSLTEPQHVFDAIFMTPRDFATGKRYHLIPPLIS